jgi:hypothetical protein
MQTKTKQTDKKKERRPFLELMTEIFGWLQIVASPLLAGLVIGFIIYISRPDTFGILLGTSVTLIGLIAGIIWATKVWKKKGTVHFMSRVMATPELDKKDEK